MDDSGNRFPFTRCVMYYGRSGCCCCCCCCRPCQGHGNELVENAPGKGSLWMSCEIDVLHVLLGGGFKYVFSFHPYLLMEESCATWVV